MNGWNERREFSHRSLCSSCDIYIYEITKRASSLLSSSSPSFAATCWPSYGLCRVEPKPQWMMSLMFLRQTLASLGVWMHSHCGAVFWSTRSGLFIHLYWNLIVCRTTLVLITPFQHLTHLFALYFHACGDRRQTSAGKRVARTAICVKQNNCFVFRFVKIEKIKCKWRGAMSAYTHDMWHATRSKTRIVFFVFVLILLSSWHTFVIVRFNIVHLIFNFVFSV